MTICSRGSQIRVAGDRNCKGSFGTSAGQILLEDGRWPMRRDGFAHESFIVDDIAAQHNRLHSDQSLFSSRRTMSSIENKEWPLDVFRRTARGDWEKQVPATTIDIDTNHNLKPNATGMPKKGCIVVKRFRLRIALTNLKNEAQESEDHSNKQSEDGLLEVVRRGACLLLSSRKRLRAIVLKFASIRDCLDFSDRLLALNPSLNLALPVPPSPRYDSAAPKKTLMGILRSMDEDEGEDQNMRRVLQPGSVALQLQKNTLRSYAVRLMQEKRFRDYMDLLEDCLLASPEGKYILLDAAQRNSDQSAKVQGGTE